MRKKLTAALSIIFLILFADKSLALYSPSGAFYAGNLYVPPAISINQNFKIDNNFYINSFINKESPNQLKDCRASDFRTSIVYSQEITYPITKNIIPNKNVLNISVVGIDFADVLGKDKPSIFIKKEMDAMDQWIKWYSNDRLSFKWNFYDQWIHSNDKSADYEIKHPNPGDSMPRSFIDVANKNIKNAETIYNFANTDAILFVYPPEIKNINQPMNGHIGDLKSKTLGKNNSYIMTTGKEVYEPRYEGLMWSWVIHELLHPMGVSGHTPSNVFMGVMHANLGWSQSLNSWDAMTLDWMDEKDIFCIKQDNIKSNKIKIQPIGKESDGINSIMIRVDESKVLVIESYKPSKWTKNLLQKSSGILVTLVDTTKDHDHGDIPSYSNTTSFAIAPNGVTIIDNSHESSDYLLRNGKHITYANIDISVMLGSDSDIVSLERI